MKKRYGVLVGMGLAVLVGCGESDKKTAAADVPPVFVEQAIDGTATPITEARTQFKPGDEVTLTGLVMGVPNPFVEGRAVFVLGDEATITPCDAMGDDDHCQIPWDACCDPKEVRSAGTAAIQVLDESGKPARVGLKGVNGLAELSRVTVSGTVAPNSSADAFIVNATAIHIGER